MSADPTAQQTIEALYQRFHRKWWDLRQDSGLSSRYEEFLPDLSIKQCEIRLDKAKAHKYTRQLKFLPPWLEFLKEQEQGVHAAVVKYSEMEAKRREEANRAWEEKQRLQQERERIQNDPYLSIAHASAYLGDDTKQSIWEGYWAIYLPGVKPWNPPLYDIKHAAELLKINQNEGRPLAATLFRNWIERLIEWQPEFDKKRKKAERAKKPISIYSKKLKRRAGRDISPINESDNLAKEARASKKRLINPDGSYQLYRQGDKANLIGFTPDGKQIYKRAGLKSLRELQREAIKEKLDHYFVALPIWFQRAEGYSPALKLVYAHLIGYRDKETGIAWADYKNMRKMLNIGSTTISRALRELEAEGVIVDVSKKLGLANRYQVMDLRTEQI